MPTTELSRMTRAWLLGLLTMTFLGAPPARGQIAFSLANPEACYSKDLAVDHAGNILLPLYFGGTVDFDPGPGTVNRTAAGFIDNGLARYTPGGQLLWAISWGTAAMSAEIPHGIEVDAANNIYVSGYFTGVADFDPGPGVSTLTSNGDRDAYLVKFTPEGDFVWARGFGGSGTGTTAYDQGWGVDVDGTGKSAQVGFFNNTTNDIDTGAGTTVLTSAGDTDAFVILRDADGNLLWAFGFGSTGADTAMAVRFADNGDVVVAGGFQGTVDMDPGPGSSALTSAGSSDVFIARYSASGAFQSAFRFGGGASDAPIPGGLMMPTGGDILVCGNFQAVADFDPGAGVLTRTSNGLSDTFIARYSASGSPVWVNAFGGAGIDGAHRMALDSEGNVYATGYFTGSPDFDPGSGLRIIPAQSGGSDLFAASYASDGTFRWAHGFGDPAASESTETSLGTGVEIDSMGNVLVTGPFFGSVDFDPGPNNLMLTSGGEEDTVLLQLRADTGMLTTTTQISAWMVY